MVIARATSREVAFKAATTRDSIVVGQRELTTRRTDGEGLGPEGDNNNKDALELRGDLLHVAYNADLFIASQEDNALE